MVAIIREADRDPVSAVAKRHGISEQTIYTWRGRLKNKAGQTTTTPTDRNRASTGSHRTSSQHAPIRPEQTLLMNESKLGQVTR
jgi:transposase-like protein